MKMVMARRVARRRRRHRTANNPSNNRAIISINGVSAWHEIMDKRNEMAANNGIE
jgi:hypothetical protein